MHDFDDGFDDIFDIAFAEPRMQWKTHEPLILGPRHRKLVLDEVVLVSIERMNVNRNEVNACTDVALDQFIDERRAIYGQSVEV